MVEAPGRKAQFAADRSSIRTGDVWQGLQGARCAAERMGYGTGCSTFGPRTAWEKVGAGVSSEDGEGHVGLEPQVRACGGELLAVPVEVGLGILDGRDGVRRLGDARKDGTHMGGRAASCSCQ